MVGIVIIISGRFNLTIPKLASRINLILHFRGIDLFNFCAWRINCGVLFFAYRIDTHDSEKRSLEEQAAMLKELGYAARDVLMFFCGKGRRCLR
ncbi:MAG TPA: hypothetical protein ENN29_12220 [Candidatus Hydrogenedentes bacterium]|nr:hypothetical protein [Candidatus Hydrogenedentota bacterium]